MNTTLLTAAEALAALARKQQAAIANEPIHGAPREPLLLEGELTGLHLDVAMPDGTTWKYVLTIDEPMPFSRAVRVYIEPRLPRFAVVFRPFSSGRYAYMGSASRYGVERGDAS